MTHTYRDEEEVVIIPPHLILTQDGEMVVGGGGEVRWDGERWDTITPSHIITWGRDVVRRGEVVRDEMRGGDEMIDTSQFITSPTTILPRYIG